jgi:hypothetical protein
MTFLVLTALRDAAYVRHAVLVTALYGHNREAWIREMASHRSFVDSVYRPWMCLSRR